MTPMISILNSLVFAGIDADDIENLEQRIEALESDCDSDRTDSNVTKLGCRRPSIYVEAFEDMVNRVHQFEHHLLTEKEWDVFSVFSRLCYNARYCLVRLLLRKPDRWHTEASMATFIKEVGEEGLHRALVDLCLPFTPPVKVQEKEVEIPVKEEPEIIDLTFDEEEDQKWAVTNAAEAGPSQLDINPILETSHINRYGLDDISNHVDLVSTDPDIDFFCRSEATMTLYEVLNKLGAEELKDLVKSTKVRPRRMVKFEMISALMSHASTQSVLAFSPANQNVKGKRKDRDNGLRQTILPFVPKGKGKESQERRLMEMALKKLGTCVTLNPDFYKLIERINVLDERATVFPKSLLLPALLTCFKKRTYPDYKYTRTSNIWSCREELIQYVAALELEAILDQALVLPNESPKLGTKNPGSTAFVPPTTPVPRRNITTPLRTPRSSSAVQYAETPVSMKKQVSFEQRVESIEGGRESVLPETLVKMENAKKIKRVFDTVILPRWKALVAAKQEDARVRPSALERFEPGFVYTRLFGRAQDALRTLKDHQGEVEVLEALLGQKHWRRRKRGSWYERRAVLQTRHLCWTDNDVLFRAMKGVQEALKDEDTGLVFRPSLLRRLRALEKKLKVPEVERAVVERELRKAKVVSFSAERLEKSSTSLHLDTNLEHLPGQDNNEDVRNFLISPKTERRSSVAEKENNFQEKPLAKKPKKTGKSLWKGENGEELNVEMRALQHYENLGYKGFHSESRILTMIFALLFWDIIFADIPGAFETPYQDAPLDIAQETFYYARKAIIDTRLKEIREGQARAILERHDDAYREKDVRCVGVQWNICGKQDLVEIVECLVGESLSTICRLLCEDYGGRSSGVPDLVVWNAELRHITFVEVKGPGDRPQENQKLWFDTLLNAGADVEICKVLDVNDKADTASKGKKKREGANPNRRSSKNVRGKMKPGDSDPQSEDEEGWAASLSLATPTPDPSSSGRKRIRPPDDYHDSLPVFSPASSSIAASSGRRSIGRPSKKQKLRR